MWPLDCAHPYGALNLSFYDHSQPGGPDPNRIIVKCKRCGHEMKPYLSHQSN
jgi:hypothetical protein